MKTLPREAAPGKFIFLSFPYFGDVWLHISEVQTHLLVGFDLASGKETVLRIDSDNKVRGDHNWHAKEIRTLNPIEVRFYLKRRLPELRAKAAELLAEHQRAVALAAEYERRIPEILKSLQERVVA